MNKLKITIITLFVLASSALAQTSSSFQQITPSSSSFSCPCYANLESAENSLSQLHLECKENKGDDSFFLNKIFENCYCIEGACDIHYSSASVDSIYYETSSSSAIIISSSSEYVYEGNACKINETYYAPIKNIPSVHQTLYSALPHMNNTDKIAVTSCSCNQDGSFKCIYENFGVPIGYEPIEVPLCGFQNAYWCPGIENGTCDYTKSSIEIYHSDKYWNTGYTWGVKNFSNTEIMEINEATQPLYVMATNGKRYTFFWMNRPLPENITTHTLEQAFLQANPRFPSANKMNEFCRGEWFPHDEDCFGYSYEVEVALTDSVETCALAMGIAKYDTTLSERGWCVVGTCEPGEEPYYSSSSYAGSSSSEESSSSSEFGLCQSLPFGYIPSDPKSTCFESNGKCYRCNAARRADECDEEWMWIYPYTPDKYFFTEIDCISGERKDNNRIGQCPGFPMETIPYNPEQACIAHNGKCYRCKFENSYVNCSHDWLWTGENFGTHNIGAWYEEVDCNDPFEEKNNDERCLDGIALMKRTADYDDESSGKDNAYSIDLLNTARYFDALGRGISMTKSTRQIFYKKINRKMQNHNANIQLQQSIEEIFKELNLQHSNRVLLKKQDCGILREDYGVIENGQKVGGITCFKADPLFDTPKVLDDKFLDETCIIKGCEYKKVWVKFGTTLQMKLNSIDYYVVNVGYVFPDGYVTTQIDHDAVEKHEKGHAIDFQCIADKFSDESLYSEIEVEACNEDGALNAAIKEKLQPYLDEMQKEYNLRFMNATERYHSKYGSFEYPGNDYVCPNDL